MKGEAKVRMICIMVGSVLAAVLVPLAVRARVAAPRPVEAPSLPYLYWEGRVKISTNGQTQGMHLNPALVARGEYLYAMWSKQGSSSTTDYDPNYNWSGFYGDPWDGWDNTEVNIQPNLLNTENVDMAVDNAGGLHFVWAEVTDSPITRTLYYSYSNASGIETILPEYGGAMVPAIAVGSSTAHVVWSQGSGEIKYSSRSFPSGSWSAPSTVRSSGLVANPAIAVEGSTVHVAWNEGAPGEILYRKKNGSWSSVKTVSHDVTLGSYVPALATSGSNVYAVWCEFQGTPTQTIRFGQSGDGGSTWGGSTPISGGPLAANDQIPYYLRPDIAVDISGTLHVVFNGSTTMGGFEDVFYVSKEPGYSWTARKDVSEKAQPIGALAHDANSTTPAIAVSGNYVHVIWAEQWVDDPNDQYEVIYRRRVSLEWGEGGVFLPIILKSW